MENRFFEGSLILGIDHGYGNMKTRNTVFKSGVITSESMPTFGTDVIEYDNKFYHITRSGGLRQTDFTGTGC